MQVSTKPAGVLRTGKLEVWAHEPSRRFASQWSGDDGALKHALWRPSRGVEYVLNPATSPVPVRRAVSHRTTISLSEFASKMDMTRLESSFMRWLESRDFWRTIGFDSGLLYLVDPDGGRLRMVPCSADERQMLCLTADRTSADITAEVLVQVDPRNHRTRLQKLRAGTRRAGVRVCLEHGAGG